MYKPLVAVEGLRPHAALHGIAKPPLQILAHGLIFGVVDQTAFPIREGSCQFSRHLLAGLAVERLAPAPFGRVDDVLGSPPAVLAAVDSSFAVTALTHGS